MALSHNREDHKDERKAHSLVRLWGKKSGDKNLPQTESNKQEDNTKIERNTI